MADRFWHEIEGRPWAEVRAIQEAQLRRQVAYLEGSSEFYRTKLRAAGVGVDKIRTTADLARVPFTLKTELRDSLAQCPPLGFHLAAPMSRVIQIQASSGTTGSPSYIGLTQHDIRVWCEMGARTFYANGFRPGDVCLHAFSMSKGFVGGLPVVEILQYMGVCDIPVGADAGVERLLRVCADQRPQVITGTPYFMIYMAEQAPAVLGCQAKDLGVRSISVGGEPGGGIPAVRASMEGLWAADVREMLGGTDLGCTYFGECEDKSGMHACAQEFILVEIIDPESGEQLPAESGVKGELVYTAIDREASPLLRFRTGDHVEVLGTSCRCGRTSPKIRCFGRTDDMLIVRGVNVFPSAIKDVVARLEPRTTGAIKVVADFPGHTTQRPLRVKVEHGPGVAAAELPALKAELEGRLREALAFRPVVELVPPDTFEKPGVQKVSLIERVTTAAP
jgi:phenylacetate-CoA ligase